MGSLPRNGTGAAVVSAWGPLAGLPGDTTCPVIFLIYFPFLNNFNSGMTVNKLISLIKCLGSSAGTSGQVLHKQYVVVVF